jgi:hypothetical protein
MDTSLHSQDGAESPEASGFAPLLVIIPPVEPMMPLLLVELTMAPLLLLVELLVETVPLLVLPLLDVGSPLVELGPGSPLAVAAA